MHSPRLLRLESCNIDYTVKATVSGVSFMMQNRFKKRYTGSKSHAVDINGKLWIDAKELKKITGPERIVARKKKGAAPPGAAPATDNEGYKITDDFDELPTFEQDFLTNLPDLSTPELSPEKKGYRINAREVRQRLLGMINSAAGKKELYFWTITFPKNTGDLIAYRAFNTWLTTLRARDKYNGRRYLKNYLWIAERQQNGTVHFHIAIPHKLPVQKANGAMRTILKNLSVAGLLPFTPAQCKRYNGVDIAKNRKTKRVTNFAIKKGARALSTYLTKYVTKNDAKFSHLAWHNSRGFSALFTAITFTRWEFRKRGSIVDFYGEGSPAPVLWENMLNKNPASWRKVYLPRPPDDPVPVTPEEIKADDEKRLLAVFVPWLKYCPPDIENHLCELNSYCQYLAEQNERAKLIMSKN